MSQSGALRRWELACLVAILALAAALRMGAPGITEFKRDEANLSQLALDLARGKSLPLLGISSSAGIPNPPHSVYLFALPYIFDKTPVLATLYIGALNVLAVGLTWLLVRRSFGPRAALIAALLYAASPWSAIFARKIWAQNLLPPFVVATMLCGLLGYRERRRWAQVAHWPLLALTVQIHLAALALVPLSLAMVALWARNARGRLLAAGLVLAGLVVVPTVIGARDAGLLTLDTLERGIASENKPSRQLTAQALELAWLTAAGTNIHALAGPEQFRAYRATVPGADPLFWLVPLGAAASAGALIGQAARAGFRRHQTGVVLALWLALPVLAFTWEWTAVAQHYLIPMLPAAFALAGVGGASLWEHLPRTRAGYALRAALAGVLVALVALQAYHFAALLRFVDTHDTPGGFGTPLGDLLAIRSDILARDPHDVIVISGGEVAPYDEIPAVWGVLLDGIDHVRFVNGQRTAVVPAGRAVELIAVQPGLRPCSDAQCRADQSDAAVFEPRPGGPAYVVRTAGADPWADEIAPVDPVRFANGAHLTGFALLPGEVLLQYRLSGPAPADYQVFAHALASDGNRLAQADRPGWPGRYWREGDTLYLWFELAIPDAAARLSVGMYTLDSGVYRNVEVLDERGAYLAQAAELPLGAE